MTAFNKAWGVVKANSRDDEPRCDNCGTTEGVENKGHQTGGASYWACGPTDSCGKNKKLREGDSQ